MVNKSKEVYRGKEMKECLRGGPICFSKVSISFGERSILDNVSFLINQGERVGLVGPNGVGKTTIIKLILGELQPDSGSITVSKSAKIGYMPQEFSDFEVPQNLTAQNFMLSVRGLDTLTERIEQICSALQESSNEKGLLLELAKLQENFERAGGYEASIKIKIIFSGLRIPEELVQKPISAFSGGLKRRLLLAQILYLDPDILLLDEPTNHLDEEGLMWLGDYLGSFKGTVIAVSHHQEFLDKFCRKILYLNPNTCKVETYKGNYSFFLSLKDKRERQQTRLAVFQEEERKRLQAFVDRWRAGTRAKQAQSRLKILEKMEEIEKPKKERKIKLNFPVKERSGDPVISVKNVTKIYEREPVFPPLSFYIRRGERILIAGPNGAGKTTLLKMIAGIEKPTEGQINLGYKVSVGYYDQEGKTLDLSLTPIEQLKRDFPNASYQRVRQVLGHFLLSAQSEIPISRLSQGEKCRLILAQLMISGANFLVLDEPTNHLDAKSRQSLKEALMNYEGTIILVSHDKEFISGLGIRRVLSLPQGIWSWAEF